MGIMVIQRNGKTTVLTGWRAWLASGAAFILIALFLFVIAFLFLGLTITLFTVLLIVVPAAVAVGLVASMFKSPPLR